MAELNFPSSPVDGQVYAPNGATADYWKWNATGSYWRVVRVDVASLNGLTGPVEITAGTNVTVSIDGQAIRIASSGGGGAAYYPPIATSSITGVASFGSEFNISATGNVSLTANYVKSFNGATGAVTYSPRLATASLTGVASFDSSFFTVSATGNVVPTSKLLQTVTVDNPTTASRGIGAIIDGGVQTTKTVGMITQSSGATTTNVTEVFVNRPLYFGITGSTAAITLFGPGITSSTTSFDTSGNVTTFLSYCPIGAAEVSMHLQRIGATSGLLVGSEFVRMTIVAGNNAGGNTAAQYTESRILSGLQTATFNVVDTGSDVYLTATPVSSTDTTLLYGNVTLYRGSLAAPLAE